MKAFLDKIIPPVGIEVDVSPIFHFFRDLLLTVILWQIGYRDFQAAFTTLLAAGFFEAGNGICSDEPGSLNHFDFLDLLAAVLAGFTAVSLLANRIEFRLLLDLTIIYLVAAAVLVLLNLLLGRDIIIKKQP